MSSICVQCGSEKLEYHDKCGACGFQPESDEELAASLILSEEILADGWQTGEFNFPRDLDELKAIADALRRGQKYRIEDGAIDHVIKVFNDLELQLSQISWTKLIFHYFLQGIITLGWVIYLVVMSFVMMFHA